MHYKINRLLIKNFKPVDEVTVDFRNSNLTVLDGPNGYGKTTIFDAIELGITGQIHRITNNKISSRNQGYNDILLSKNQQEDTIIKLEFINDENETLIIARYLKNEGLNRIQKKPNNWALFELYELENFEDDISTGKVIPQRLLDKVLEGHNISDCYNLYNYVQQEESTHLIKYSEENRVKEISKLFNIQKETEEYKSLSGMSRKLKKHIGNLKKELETKRKQLNLSDKDNIDEGKSLDVKVEYKPLLPNKKNIIWDKENIQSLDEESRKVYISTLNNIQLLKKLFEDYIKESENKKIQTVIKDHKKLKALIVYSNFSDSFEELEKKYNIQSSLNTIEKILNEKDFRKYKEIDFNWLNKHILTDVNQSYVKEKVKSILLLEKNTDEISKMLHKLNTTRERLKNQFENLVSMNENFSKECPLCGSQWSEYSELIDSIDNQKDNLLTYSDTNTNLMEKEINDLYENQISKVIEAIQSYFSDNSFVEETFYKQLLEYKNTIKDIKKAKKWFQEKGLNIELFLNDKEIYLTDLENRLEMFVLNIKQLEKSISEEYLNLSESTKKEIDFIFLNYFDKNHELIKALNDDEIDRKKEYINYMYYLHLDKSFKSFKEISNEIKSVETMSSNIDSILNVYKEKINKYRGRMIRNIEIPFYIYSGKIIQNYQRGLGIFIKEEIQIQKDNDEQQLKSIMFIPSAETDHDVVHSFSSGQISAMVIALTLALNKVYNTSKFNSILIDDPVQTMDEINMTSLLDLLRSNFKGNQLIVSTHEDNVSLFMRYKFLKHNLVVNRFNVRKELYRLNS